MKKIGIIVLLLLIFTGGLTTQVYSKFEPRLADGMDKGQPPFFSLPPPADSIWVREGDTLQFELEAEDPDGEGVSLSAYGLPPQSNFQDLGEGKGEFTYTPDFYQAYGIYHPYFLAIDNEGLADTARLTIFLLDVNQPPGFSPIPPDTIVLSEEEILVDTIFAIDPTDAERGPLTISIMDTLSLPEEFTFQAYPYRAIGIISFSPGYDFSYRHPGGSFNVRFYVTDRQGLASNNQMVTFKVKNLDRLPSLQITPDSLSLIAGDTVYISFSASDPDSDDQLHIAIDPLPGGAGFEFNSQTGEGSFTWVTTIEDTGMNWITFYCDDGQGGRDSVIAYIWVESPFSFTLRIPDFEGWPGQRGVHLPIYLSNRDYIGGFNILITYDVTVAELVGVQPYPALESFNYTLMGNGEDKLRMVGICDLPNSTNTPPIPPGKNRPLVDLIVNLSPYFSDFSVPVRFVTEKCGDNVLTDSLGLYMWSADPDCPPDTIPGNPHPNPSLDLVDGSIYLQKVDRGDVNLDGLRYNIADAVYFCGYLLGGVTLIDPPRQGAASDINGDGHFWSIADLIMLVSIVNGQTPPPPKLLNPPGEIMVNLVEENGLLAVRPSLTSSFSGAYLVFNHQGKMGKPSLARRSLGMTLKARDDGEKLRVIIYSLEEDKIAGGDGPILLIPAEGEVTLEKAEFADENGHLILGKPGSQTSLPQALSLNQNYPNPFNSTTAINYSNQLSADGRRRWTVTLRVYNIAGQLVRTLVDERQRAGVHSVVWDGRDAQGQEVGSGIYFYRLQVTGDRLKVEKSRKMVLLR